MTTPGLHVLVADDEKNIRATLAMYLQSMGCTVTQAATAEAAGAAVARAPFDVAFVDLRFGEADGMELVPRLLREQAGLAIVIITAFGTIDTAVEAMRRGAADFITKPFTPARIQQLIARLGEQRALRWRLSTLEEKLADAIPEADLHSQAPAMLAVLDMARRAAAADAPVLIRGESGTGKSVLAQAIHAWSPRSMRPFVLVNCPTLSDELLTSELFGHIKGAFTGAVRDQIGKVEAAEGGTLFLDEITEISPALQAKLLRFLQEKKYERIGETRTRSADLRILAATNRDVDQEIAAGRFREDLFYRLNVIEMEMPALRDRPEDILPLARHFLAFFNPRIKSGGGMTLNDAACAALQAYPWPGNIRELRNALERATILAAGAVIGPEVLPGRIAAHKGSAAFLGGDFTLDAIEHEHILRVLARASTFDEAARLLGVDASTLRRRRQKYEAT